MCLFIHSEKEKSFYMDKEKKKENNLKRKGKDERLFNVMEKLKRDIKSLILGPTMDKWTLDNVNGPSKRTTYWTLVMPI